MSTALSGYIELADILGQLDVLARSARRMRRLTLRSAATEIGVAPSTLKRIEDGEDCAVSSAMRVLRWLGNPVRPGDGRT